MTNVGCAYLLYDQRFTMENPENNDHTLMTKNFFFLYTLSLM